MASSIPIKRLSARKNAARKAINHRKNKAARAELYRSYAGSSNWQRDVAGWHSTLRALSMGTI